MKDVIQFLELHWPEIVSGFATLVALVTTGINLAKGAKLSRAVEDAKSKGYQVRCPKCKKTSPLSEVQILLPSGELDANLDGIPDNQL